MDESGFIISGETTVAEALEILRLKVDFVANSDEAKRFQLDNPSWSNLFRTSFEPYKDAVDQYEEALRLNEWLNGRNPDSGKLTIKEMFLGMSEQDRLSLFRQRVNSKVSGIFDEYLMAWWLSRY